MSLKTNEYGFYPGSERYRELYKKKKKKTKIKKKEMEIPERQMILRPSCPTICQLINISELYK